MTDQWDVLNRLINALVVIAGLAALGFATSFVFGYHALDAAGKPVPLGTSELAGLLTVLGGLIVSLVGAYFGVNIAVNGVQAAQQASLTANNLAAAYQQQSVQAAAARGVVTGGLATLRQSAPPELHSMIDNISQQVGG